MPQDSLDETLGLVCSGRVAREAGAQAPLIAVLADAGADLDAAMLPALGHGEFEAVEALIAAGATVDLPVAAATGRNDTIAMLYVQASALARHQALALAALHGHATILRQLLQAGEDPDRYNPPGCHAHSTPLHQAALAGHLAVVDVLLSWGCATDLRDLHHKATPLDWSRHAGRDTVARRLEIAEAEQAGASQ